MKANLYICSVILWILFVVAGCSKSSLNEDELIDCISSNVTITTRSTGDAAIEYPVTLYAFSADNTIAASAVANNADDKLSMNMVAGSYRLIAVAGTDGLDIPEEPTANSNIGIPGSGIMTEALQRGAVDITVSDKDVTADISLAYQVAQINLELHDIPTDITKVSVTFSTIYSQESFNGDYSGSKAVTASLTKTETEGVWKAETFYVLPGSGSQLTLSIAMTDTEGTMNYGYTHTSTLKVATPYQLTGSYLEGFEVSGNISAEGWAETETINFTFGLDGGTPSEGDNDENEDSEDNNEETNDDGEILVNEIPSIKTIWNNHLVILKPTADATQAELVLMSLQEWQVQPAEASSIAENYTENEIDGWRIPTDDEMIKISQLVYGTTSLTNVNSLITGIGGDNLVSLGYYLCSDAERIVLMGVSNPTSMSSTSTNTYYLRLVKTITVRKSE